MFYLIRSSVTTLPADTADFLLSLLRACPVLQLASRRYVCQRFSSPAALLPITATITLPVCFFQNKSTLFRSECAAVDRGGRAVDVVFLYSFLQSS